MHLQELPLMHDRVYATEFHNNRVSAFSTEGKFLKSLGEAKAQFKSPRSVHVNKDGFILIADCGNNRIQVF